MEGVRVLAEQAIYSYNNFLIFIAATFIAFDILCFIGGVVAGAIGLLSKDPICLFGVFLLVTSVVLGGLGLLLESNIEKTKVLNYIEQKVIIEDTVNINEFFDHYELLDQDGEIYIVKVKPIE